jgi:RimJ/RimL family protein N-acetyltransferase
MKNDILQTRLKGYGVALRKIEEDDLEQLLSWRNRPDIRTMMRSSEVISKASHHRWFNGLSLQANVRHFSICYKDKLIGSANLVTESATLFEATKVIPGLYIGDMQYRGNILAFAPSLVLNDYCFETLGVGTMVATVHHENAAAIAYNTKLGYKINSTRQDKINPEEAECWIDMTLIKENYQPATVMVKRFLSRT